MGPTQYTVEYDPSTRRYYLVDQNGQRNTGPGYGEGFDSQNDAREAADEENLWNQRAYETPDPRTGESQADRDAAQRERDAAARADADDPEAARERMDRGESRSNGLDYPQGGSAGTGANVSDFDAASADIPIWGWLSGAQARRDAANAENEADRMEAGWDALSDYMPTPDDLAVDYEQSEYAEGPTRSELGNAQADANAIGQQRYAMDALRGIVDEGGLTQADRARMQLGEMEVGRSMRASREADLAAMQARGMGGSGAEMASVLGAQQAGADGLFSRDAEMQIEAQRRRDAAISALGGMAGDVRGQSFDEAATRGSATDDLNRWNTERRQGWYEDNTDRRNQSRESRSAARQQSYENRERQQAGKTNQWNSASAGRRADQARQDASNQAAAGVVGTLFEEIL